MAEPAVGPDLAAAESTWVNASTELRSTAKWVITALAAVAAVVFGVGPVITRPSLDFENNLVQLGIAFGLGVAGLIGIGLLIFSMSKVLLPIEMSMDDLPPELLTKIKDKPASILPGGVSTLGDFRDRLAAWRTAAVQYPAKFNEHRQAVSEAQVAGDKVAEQQARNTLAVYENGYSDNQANLVTYEAVRADLIDRGAYTLLSGTFSRQSKRLWAGALLAGIGGLGFQLALTSAPNNGASTADASPIGTVAILSHRAGAADFWKTYKLAGCETSGGQVPVLVTDGHGTEDSPYMVQTIPDRTGPDSTCPAISFPAAPDMFSVVVPKPDEVNIKVDRGSN